MITLLASEVPVGAIVLLADNTVAVRPEKSDSYASPEFVLFVDMHSKVTLVQCLAPVRVIETKEESLHIRMQHIQEVCEDYMRSSGV